jgi:hypothetical protein
MGLVILGSNGLPERRVYHRLQDRVPGYASAGRFHNRPPGLLQGGVRILLISNSGQPHLENRRGALGDFFGPSVRRVGFISAAMLADPEHYFNRAKDGLEPLSASGARPPRRRGRGAPGCASR